MDKPPLVLLQGFLFWTCHGVHVAKNNNIIGDALISNQDLTNRNPRKARWTIMDFVCVLLLRSVLLNYVNDLYTLHKENSTHTRTAGRKHQQIHSFTLYKCLVINRSQKCFMQTTKLFFGSAGSLSREWRCSVFSSISLLPKRCTIRRNKGKP